jgi:hypothetical protein
VTELSIEVECGLENSHDARIAWTNWAVDRSPLCLCKQDRARRAERLGLAIYGGAKAGAPTDLRYEKTCRLRLALQNFRGEHPASFEFVVRLRDPPGHHDC